MTTTALAVVLLINGTPVDFGKVPAHLKPSIENGVILVPVRQVMEAVGAKVEFGGHVRRTYVTYKGRRVAVFQEYTKRYNSIRNIFYPKPLPQQPLDFLRETSYAEAKGNTKVYRLVLPLGFLADTFGFSLKWDNEKKVVQVRAKP